MTLSKDSKEAVLRLRSSKDDCLGDEVNFKLVSSQDSNMAADTIVCDDGNGLANVVAVTHKGWLWHITPPRAPK